MADLTREDILKLARLSKLELTEEQIDRFQTEIQSIVKYVEHLQSVDVEGLEPTNQVTGLVNVTRPDKIAPTANRSALLKNLPKEESDHIKVKRMIG